MSDITKKLVHLAEAVDVLAGHLEQDIALILAAGKEIKDSLPKKPEEDKQE
jgi:hypothetical protein